MTTNFIIFKLLFLLLILFTKFVLETKLLFYKIVINNCYFLDITANYLILNIIF